MSTGAPWVLVVILIALNVLGRGSLVAAEREEFARRPSGDNGMRPRSRFREVRRRRILEGTWQVPQCGHSLGRWSRR